MRQLTRQDCFDKVWNHFVVEKNPLSFELSGVGDRLCLYRGLNGEKCAIGILIPDDKWNPDCENQSPVQALANCGIKDYFHDEVFEALDGIYFLRDLQGAHDIVCYTFASTGSTKSTIETSLRNLAKKWKLKIQDSLTGPQ